MIVHVEPCSSIPVQLPMLPTSMSTCRGGWTDDALHGWNVKEHAAAVSVPAVHELVPETVYPGSHVGWHVDPLARELVQSPTPPLAGGMDASHLGNFTTREYPTCVVASSFVHVSDKRHGYVEVDAQSAIAWKSNEMHVGNSSHLAAHSANESVN